MDVKTDNTPGTYSGTTQLNNGDKIKPQILGVATTDEILAASVSFGIGKN